MRQALACASYIAMLTSAPCSPEVFYTRYLTSSSTLLALWGILLVPELLLLPWQLIPARELQNHTRKRYGISCRCEQAQEDGREGLDALEGHDMD